MINDKGIIMLQWTEIILDAMVLKINVYFEWHIAVPSLTIMQQKCGNNNMCPLYIFVEIYCDIK